MVWTNFPLYAFIIICFWLLGLIMINVKARNSKVNNIGVFSLVIGLLILIYFVTHLWILLERPPLRTLGETRLWYSLFLAFVGLVTYTRWKYKWFLSYTFGVASFFLILNILHPENYDKTLMPALQSIWFVPHVIVYILSYALLAASSLVAIHSLIQINFYNNKRHSTPLADNLVYIGFAFLTMGLLFGALWAKEAWGHYWTWDPKETWALLTWLIYLIYIHIRSSKLVNHSNALWVLALAFVVLLICWFGVNYLPSAANSVHTYSNTN